MGTARPSEAQAPPAFAVHASACQSAAEMRVLFVADYFADTDGDSGGHYPGGAEQTDAAVIAACPWPIERVQVRGLDEAALDQFDLFLLGNLDTATQAQCDAIAGRSRHVLFEHDYRMCRLRGSYQSHWTHRLLGRCVCRLRRFDALFASALGAVFLTRRQLERYLENPFLRLPAHEVLGCSVMGAAFFEAVKRHRERPLEKHGTVVVHSARRFKGFARSLEYCKTRGIEPLVVEDASPAELLDVFARSERLVFLPEWYEPASRLAVEARFLGCEIVSNERLGVAGEPWWNQPDAVGLAVLSSAAERFWEIVARFAAPRASAERTPRAERSRS